MHLTMADPTFPGNVSNPRRANAAATFNGSGKETVLVLVNALRSPLILEVMSTSLIHNWTISSLAVKQQVTTPGSQGVGELVAVGRFVTGRWVGYSVGDIEGRNVGVLDGD